MNEELNTNTQDHSPKNIGELLRSAREKKDLNLKTISQQTKIHIALLEHLENNELNKLPSKTYVRGFVKAASKVLSLNQEEALDLLERSYGEHDHSQNKPKQSSSRPNNLITEETVRNTLSSTTPTPLEAVRSVTLSSGLFIIKGLVLIFIVGVVGFYLKNLMDRSSEEKIKLPVVLSTIQQKIKHPPKPQKVAIPKTEEKTAEIKVNLIQDKKENTPKEIVVNDVNLKSVSAIEKQFSINDKYSKEDLDQYLPARFRVNKTAGAETLFVNASEGDSWLTYKVDDKEIKKFVLRQGRTLFLHGSSIRIFIGNTNSVKLFHNNQPITLNSKSISTNLVLPEERKTKYMNPLFVFEKDGSAYTSEEYIKLHGKIPEKSKEKTR